jgi:hypothetical protein
MTFLSKPVVLGLGGLLAFVFLNKSAGATTGKFDPFAPPKGSDPVTADDLAFTNWIHNPSSGAPPLDVNDLAPTVIGRKLTNYERWVLKPYVYVDDLDKATIKNGIRPAGIPEDGKLPGADGKPSGAVVLALTTADGSIWFPAKPVSFLNRWWLATLAHELYHVGQIRLGSTNAEATEAWKQHGYVDSPIEVSARWKQAEVYNGVTRDARAFAAKQASARPRHGATGTWLGGGVL